MTVISILFTVWEKVRNKKLIQAFELIQKYPKIKIFDYIIFAINDAILETAIRRGLAPSIQAIVEYLAVENHRKPRIFNFKHLKEFINNSEYSKSNAF